jgi:hypothetical protein
MVSTETGPWNKEPGKEVRDFPVRVSFADLLNVSDNAR